MGGLLRLVLFAVLILVAVVIGAIVGIILYRRLLHLNHIRYVQRSAMKLREGLLREFPPGDRPVIHISPADDLGIEQWDYLVEQGLAVVTAFQIAAKAPPAVTVSEFVEEPNA